MNEIVERLRDWNDETSGFLEAQEGADEIERLEKSVKELAAALTKIADLSLRDTRNYVGRQLAKAALK